MRLHICTMTFLPCKCSAFFSGFFLLGNEDAIYRLVWKHWCTGNFPTISGVFAALDLLPFNFHTEHIVHVSEPPLLHRLKFPKGVALYVRHKIEIDWERPKRGEVPRSAYVAHLGEIPPKSFIIIIVVMRWWWSRTCDICQCCNAGSPFWVKWSYRHRHQERNQVQLAFLSNFATWWRWWETGRLISWYWFTTNV